MQARAHLSHDVTCDVSPMAFAHLLMCAPNNSVMRNLIVMLYMKVICKRLNFCFIYLLLNDHLLVRDILFDLLSVVVPHEKSPGHIV